MAKQLSSVAVKVLVAKEGDSLDLISTVLGDMLSYYSVLSIACPI